MSEEFDRCQPHVTLPAEGCDLLDVAEQILMRRFEVDADRAHTLLVRAAHHSRTKLFDVCTNVRDAQYGGVGDLSSSVLAPAAVNEELDRVGASAGGRASAAGVA